MITTQEWGERARAASMVLKTAGSEEKNEMLRRIAQALRTETDAILAANAVDLEAAREAGMRETMLDRLSLSKARIEGIAAAVEALIKLENPIGEVIRGFTRPNGLEIRQVRVPLGT
ncbi:MAG: gamma-glutamyl-phosphate reductase, partial [Firmicutes bacterium]|nr:gamma-glutamyl-phosphate reductase [Bacillota bacterium]